MQEYNSRQKELWAASIDVDKLEYKYHKQSKLYGGSVAKRGLNEAAKVSLVTGLYNTYI